MKILVLEDEPVARAILANRLREQGHEVRDAWRPNEALEMAAEFQPDILITDWRLNDRLDGIDVAKAMKKDLPGLQVVLVSAYQPVHEEIVKKGLIPDAVLDKPMGFAKMAAAVELAITHLRTAESVQ